jgi:hypothetical protein
MRTGSERRSPWWVAAAVLMVAAGCSSAPGGSSAPPSGTAPGAGPAVTAIKIDNVAAARPATGLSAADTIYVELVEGGLTRIVAVFGAHRPDLVGPVRSARPTDIDLLAQYGKPTFAYSGSAPELRTALRSGEFVNAAQSDVPKAYLRRSTHAAPHNLYVRPALLPTGTGPSAPVQTFGTAPQGGTPATDQKVRYPAASYEFRWSPDTKRWLVWMDGTPFRTTETGQVGAATVVVQRVATSTAKFHDSAGSPVPVAQTVGSGPATVLRDGQSYAATWTRTAAAAPTRFTLTKSGQAVPFANGQVWVLLLPR